MIIQGTCSLPRAPAIVFQALIDPTVLQQAIPGCERIEKTGDDEYLAHLKIGIAAVKGSYRAGVQISEKRPPHRFTLRMEGKGAPGFVNGTARIELKEDGHNAQLIYNADVQVGGLIAAVGSRMIEAAAKKLIGDFFQKLSDVLKK